MSGPPPPPPPPVCWPPPPICPAAPLLPSFTAQVVTTSALWPTEIHAADANNDGCLDIFVATSLEDDPELILQDFPCASSTVSLQPPVPITDNGVYMDVADFTGDGVPDVLLTKVDITGTPFFPYLFLQTASLVLTPSPSPAVSFTETVIAPVFTCPGDEDLALVEVADLNGDGFVDAVIACHMSVQLFLNDASNSFSFGGGSVMTFGNFPENLKLLDLNNDGSLDIIASASSSTYFALGSGTGTFGTQILVGTAGANEWACAADFDGNGFLDLVTHDGNAIIIHLNDGSLTPSFSAHVVVCPAPADVHGGSAIMIQCGDVNGDFLPDIVVGSVDTGTYTNGPVSAYLSCGGGVGVPPTFYEHEIYITATHPTTLSLEDMNGDGFLDVLLGSFDGGAQTTLLLNDAVTASPTMSPAPSNSPSISSMPSVSMVPSNNPSISMVPSNVPSNDPTLSLIPSVTPSSAPSSFPAPLVPIPCIIPPDDMVGWWTFDEASGATAAADLTPGGHDATLLNSVGMGVPGYVSTSSHFDGISQHAVVPHHSDFNFPDLKFTIDFWIRPDPGELYGTIVRKGVPSAMIPNLAGPGYHLWYNTGHFFMAFSDGSSSWFFDISPTTTYHAWPGVWTFVAVVLDFSPGGSIDLWIDGVLAQTTSIGSGPGPVPDTTNTDPLVIAGLDAPLLGCPPDGSFFAGRIDELEIFDRPLTGTEVQNIYNAGSGGKCKDSIHVPWDKGICVNKQWTDSQIEICNNGVVPATYNVNFGPIAANGANCLVSGPIGFEDPANVAQFYPGPPSGCTGCPGSTGPKTIGPIGPGSCGTETFRIYKNTDLTSVYVHVSCFSATVTNLITGQQAMTMGSIQGIAPCLWVEKLTYNRRLRTYNSTESEVLVPGVPRTIFLEIAWDNATKYGEELDKKYGGKFGGEETIDIVAVPFNSDMTGRRAPLSINGGREGEQYEFKVDVQKHGSKKGRRVELSISSSYSVPFSFFDIVFYKVFTADHEKREKDVSSREYTSKFPIASMGFYTTQRKEFDGDGDGIPDYEEVRAGLDPYLADIDLYSIGKFYKAEIHKVMDWLAIQTGGHINEERGGQDRQLHLTEANPYQIFRSSSPALPVAIDELEAALASVAKLDYYGATQYIQTAISAIRDIGLTNAQCKEAAQLEDAAKKQRALNLLRKRAKSVSKSSSKKAPAPNVIRYIDILEDATEKIIRYLSLLNKNS